MDNQMKRMRPILAAAGAGALVIGSAAGAMAADPTVKPTPKPGVVKIQTVDIHRHSPINIDSEKKARDIKLRVMIRDTDATASVSAVKVTLTEYQNKRQKDPVTDPIELSAELTDPKANKKSTTLYFKGAILKKDLVALGAKEIPDGASALLCISAAVPTIVDPTSPTAVATWSKQTMKRLNAGVKKPVRECVKVFNPKAKPAKAAKAAKKNKNT